MNKKDLKKIKELDWFTYLKRPLDIFSFSSNAKAYEKIKYAGRIQNLGYLYESDFTEYFRSEKEFSNNINNLKKNIKKRPEKIIAELLKGVKCNKKAEKLIEEFSRDNKILEKNEIIKLINFYIKLFTLGTVFPYLVGLSLEKDRNKNRKIDLLVKKLRMVSCYTDFRKKVLDNILKKIGFDFSNYTSDEIILFLKTGKIKKENREFYYYFKINNDIIAGSDKKIFKAIHNFISDDIGNYKKEIKGNIAYKGIVKGFARIVYNENDFDKFKKGDILITINSNPSLMSVIKKCGAIIADEGGMTCHAAIISRELKIPCIVGTSIATDLIKDGDLVEVDANRGIVRIIKKA